MIKQIIVSLASFLLITTGIHAQNIECIENLIEIPMTGYKAGEIQWQFSTDKSTWNDLANHNSETLTFRWTPSASGTYQARFLASDGYENTYHRVNLSIKLTKPSIKRSSPSRKR